MVWGRLTSRQWAGETEVSDEIRVRFAPSPTGHLHVGGARTALFNWLFARNQGGKFILRIEDTDMERSTEESYRNVVDAMKWLGLDWDEGPGVGGEYGPYHQSERRHLYREWADRLLAEGKAYTCFCSQQDLTAMREDLKKQGKDIKYDRRCRELSTGDVEKRKATGESHVIRFKTPLGGQTVVEDTVKGHITFENPTLDDFVIIKSNGYPTYNFACVVDDALMKMTHVIRGDDHLSNTPKQILVYQAFDVDLPKFAHVPMIMGPDRARLSKRHGATSVGQFRDDGYVPEAMVNYLALLGWAYDDTTTLFEVKDLISKFSLDRVSSTPAVFDYAKLQWINGEHMKKRSVEDRVALVLPHLEKAGLVSAPLDDARRTYVAKVVEVVGERLKLAGQIVELAAFFFTDEVDYDSAAAEKFLKRHYIGPAFRLLEDRFAQLDEFTAAAIEPVMRGLVSDMGLKTGDLFQPVRVALTGSRHSPDLLQLMEVLGEEQVVKRLQHARHTFA
jgi:glutamyl-tRNA synthetase